MEFVCMHMNSFSLNPQIYLYRHACMAKPLVRLIQGLTQAKQRRRRWGSKVVYFLVSTYLTAILLLFGVSSRSFSTPGPLPKIKLLFFDDEDLAYRSGTKRILHQLTKIQHPGYATRPINYAFEGLIPAHAVHSDRLWTARKEYESSISYVSVYKRPSSTNGFYPYDTNFPYQMWYQCYSQSKSQDKRKQCLVG